MANQAKAHATGPGVLKFGTGGTPVVDVVKDLCDGAEFPGKLCSHRMIADHASLIGMPGIGQKER